jgi:hypothetical protein
MAQQALIAVTWPGGNTAVVAGLDLDGMAVTEPDPGTKTPELSTVLSSVDDFSAELRGTLRAAAPNKAKVEFSVGFAMVNHDKAAGPIAISLEWTMCQR